ncbi:MAG: AbrB family transcriptional regulator [Desulfofustis sp.]|nr:AbrB family transcriptional regulator [Desulfofustis sp.]
MKALADRDRRTPAASARYGRLGFTLFIGLAGSLLAAHLGLPAAPLIGSSVAVAGAALLKLTIDVPRRLRDLAFILIGCSLGSGLTRDALAQAGRWPLSLVILAGAVIVMMLCCTLLLHKWFKMSIETASLATSPGALAYALALAAGGIGDARTIIVIQSVRLLLITTLLPLLLGLLDAPPVTGIGAAAVSAMGYQELLALFVPALAMGWLIARLRAPAAYLLAGLVVSGAAHFAGLIDGRPPADALFLGFTVTGTVIGARFSTISRTDLRRLLGASGMVLLLSVAVGAGFAYGAAVLLSLPYGQVFVAFAPGGVEAMAVMALALGYDPTYVAVHHLFRIFLLMALLPLIFGAARRRQQGNDHGAGESELRR